MKTIAIYLPQFYETEENNRWWGKGFTDWVTVKNAKVLYAGHRQPRKPLNENYYNLLEYDTMRWQANLAKKYCVSGFCFYHYWFKDGRKVLEKPAENLLKWKEIDMPFCFSWANQTWARTWTNIQNSNAWVGADLEDRNRDDGILLKQSYGGKKEWKKHFEYLLPFFKDERYIRYEGKPVFLIYKPEYMFCLDNMMEYWKELACQNGLKGVCVITVRSNCSQWSQADYWLMQELDYSFISKNKTFNNGVWTIKYKDAWEDILKRAYIESDESAFLSGFIDVDDTPRRGQHGVSIMDASPSIFEIYYRKLVELAAIKNKEMVFVNAWNEWGEGAYMEPDEEYQYGYLESIKKVMDDINNKEKDKILPDLRYMQIKTGNDECKTEIEASCAKNKRYYQILDKWFTNYRANKKIEQVLNMFDFKNIAVYGMGSLSRHLIKELENSSINIELCFDKRTDFLHMKAPSHYIKEQHWKIDAIIVTPIMEYKDLRLYLKKFFEVPIISLEELISECEIL